jgi:hypothetical protein
MHDDIASREGTSCDRRVAEVADDARNLSRLVVLRCHEIEDARLVAGAEKLIDDVGADETGSAGYEDAQDSSGELRGVTVRS